MKKMQTWTVIFAVLALGALVLTGCPSPVSNKPSQTEEDSPDVPVGFGLVRVNLTQGEARTVMPLPVLGSLYFKYWFTKDSLSPEEKSPESGVFTLEPGTYTLRVEAFVDPAKTELAADGTSASFVVTSGTEPGTVNVALRPIVSEGTGSLAFSLTYPAGGAVEYLTLTRIAGAETIDLAAGVTPSGSEPLVFSGEKTGISSGYYWLNVRIRDGIGRYAGKTEAVHIYQNLSAQAVYVFTADDFSIYTVTFSAGTGGGAAPASVNLNGGADITLPGSTGMIAPANKFFIGWSDGASLYWADDLYTVSGSVTLTARWELTAISEVEAYLGHAAGGGKANPVPLPVNLTLGGGGWDALLSALDTAGKYTALDLSDSAITGMSATAGEFDTGEANTGEKYIVSLVLPGTVTSIKAGFFDFVAVRRFATFRNFTALTNVSGIGVTAVGEYAFSYCTSLADLSLPAVASIGGDAFSGCTSLTGVILPEAVSIGNSAFSNCTSLTGVILPEAVSIGKHAFSNCASLTGVILQKAVSIDNFAFVGCMALATVNLPATLTTIGSNPFSGCVNLTTITVDPGNTAFKALGGMLLNKAGTTLIAYPSASGMVTLDSITSIGEYAFSTCLFLAEVSLPAATSIGEYAFSTCPSLTAVNLPAAASIGEYAFEFCMSLAAVNLPAAASIGEYAFEFCTSLAAVSLPAAVSIGDQAFWSCTSLVTVNLPAATSIGYATFRECTSLATVSLPAAVFIGAYAFYGCTSLAELTLPATPPTVGGYMFLDINTAPTITIKVAGSVSAYDTTWQTAFKGGNDNITLILLGQDDGVSANITLWANEDGSILGSPQNMTISKTASGNPDSFTVTVAGAYTLVQWQVNGIPLSALGNPLTIAAADYAAGNTYILGVQVTKDGAPYSTDIRFTVEP
jgi:hypothetical protein